MGVHVVGRPYRGDMRHPIRFEPSVEDGLHTYVMSVDTDDTPESAWPGLWEQDYPENPHLNPYLRFGVNNGDGEGLLLWRAVAWAITRTAATRWAIPCWHRDFTAMQLGVSREHATLVDWEYEVLIHPDDEGRVDLGFVPARTGLSIRPAPDDWERAHEHEAGLFRLNSFEDLTHLEHGTSNDAESEITIFGLANEDPSDLTKALRGARRPRLDEVLAPGDIFVDLTVVRDRFPDLASRLTVRSHTDIGAHVRDISETANSAYSNYLDGASQIKTFEQFSAAMVEMIGPLTD